MNDRANRPPLYEQRTTTRFSDRVAEYVKHRPTYPARAIDAVLDGLGAPGSLLAADVGAGTGISARLLADRGVRVIAVEPNEAMRSAAGPHDLIEWRAGTAEATNLDPGSLGLVLCAQAYHWFHPARACSEFARILRPGGRLALMWNDGDESDALTHGYYELVREVSDTGPTSHQTVAKEPTLAPPFESMRRLVFPHAQRLTRDGLIGRAMSASYVPKEGPGAARVRAGLSDLHKRYAGADGLVAMVYNVIVYLGER